MQTFPDRPRPICGHRGAVHATEKGVLRCGNCNMEGFPDQLSESLIGVPPTDIVSDEYFFGLKSGEIITRTIKHVVKKKPVAEVPNLFIDYSTALFVRHRLHDTIAKEKRWARDFARLKREGRVYDLFQDAGWVAIRAWQKSK